MNNKSWWREQNRQWRREHRSAMWYDVVGGMVIAVAMWVVAWVVFAVL